MGLCPIAPPKGFPLALWKPSGPLQQRGGAKKQIPCGWQGKSLPYFFLFYGGFRLCGGDQRAFRSPFGNLRRRNFWGCPLLDFIVAGEIRACGRESCHHCLVMGQPPTLTDAKITRIVTKR